MLIVNGYLKNNKNNNMEQRKDSKYSLIDFILSPKVWIYLAVFLVFIGLVLLVLYAFGIIISQNSFVDFFKDVFVPILTAVGFAVGFCITIQRTESIKHQTDVAIEDIALRKKELDNNLVMQRNNRTKENLRSLNQGGIMAIDAIDDLLEEARMLDEKESGYIKELQRFASILCSFLKSNSPKSVYKLDEEWSGNSNNASEWITQRIIELLFPKKVGNDRINSTPFHSHIEDLNYDLSLCDLQKINFSKRIIKNTNFGGSAMHNTEMYLSELTKCNFWGTYLQAANISNSQLKDCSFWESKLVWAKFCESTITNCNFDKSDMTATLLSSARFYKSHFDGAILDGADIYMKNKDGKFEPAIFKNPTNLNLNSISFAFVYPLQREVDTNLLNIDINEFAYKNPRNRLERYITYWQMLENMGDFDNLTTLTTLLVNENRCKLVEISKKAVKYATIDDYTGLTQEKYNRLIREIGAFINNA